MIQNTAPENGFTAKNELYIKQENVMKKYCLIGLVLIMTASGLTAQSAAEAIDALLGQDSIDLTDAAYVFLGAAGLIESDTPPDAALRMLRDLVPYYAEADADLVITSAHAALIGIKLFDVSPGIMLRLTGSPRYAYRDARYRRILQGSNNPQNIISGSESLQIAGRFASYVENNRPARM